MAQVIRSYAHVLLSRVASPRLVSRWSTTSSMKMLAMQRPLSRGTRVQWFSNTDNQTAEDEDDTTKVEQQQQTDEFQGATGNDDSDTGANEQDSGETAATADHTGAAEQDNTVGDDSSGPKDGRPDENELASMYGYHEALVYHWRQEGALRWEWINRITGKDQLVSLVNRFSVMSTPCPQLYEGVQDKVKPMIPEMEGPNLSTVAYAFAAQKVGDDSFWQSIIERANSLRGQLAEHEKNNLVKALQHIGKSQEASQI